MALFVQIDHFRKTDQKPTVKNHLFSISWFRSFNRTSFQQQLKPTTTIEFNACKFRFNRTSFQQQLKLELGTDPAFPRRLQSYILSTTTETYQSLSLMRGIVMLQSYILSTTTETRVRKNQLQRSRLLQSYILSTTTETHSKKRENSAPDQTQPNF